MLKRILIILIFLPTFSWAANESDMSFSYLTKEDGLADNNVDCIFKDSDGFMWFGTRNGLCRYDGYDIKVFRKSLEPNSISGNRIHSIVEDHEGYLWIGTFNSGLNRYDRKNNVFTPIGDGGLISLRINKLKVFSDGSIWVCANNGLFRITDGGETIQAYTHDSNNPNSLNTNVIYDVIETADKSIYVATDVNEIQKLDRSNSTFTTIAYDAINNSRSNYRKTFLEDKEGKLWITADHHGLSVYNPKTGASKSYTAANGGLSTDVLRADMAFDSKGLIWICMEEDGINVFDPKTETYEHLSRDKAITSSLNSNHAYSVFFDEQGIVWIGTFDKGINIYNPNQGKFDKGLFSLRDLDILHGHSVLDIFQDSKGRVWVGTDGSGLFLFEKNKSMQHYIYGVAPMFLSSNVITSLGEDNLGNLLIGTYSGGFMVYNPETRKSQSFLSDGSENTVSSPHIWDIYSDSRDRIWLGMLSTGAMQYFPETGRFVDIGPYANSARKIDFSNVMVVQEDSDGDVWFGTEGRGIYILDKETDRVFRFSVDSVNSFATQAIVICLKEDQWGNMWIGSEDYGLFKYNKNTKEIVRYDETDGLIEGPIQSIGEDVSGNIWVGTSFGLYRYAMNDKRFIRFVTDDGISSNDMNPDAMCSLDDGRIMVGSNNGVDIIPAEQIQLNKSLPTVAFTKLSVLNHEIIPGKNFNKRLILEQSISYTSNINLLWEDKSFALEFTALNYTLPEKCNYKYKLEGFDKDWIYTSADRRIAHYSNLDPGEYTLKVMASNNDGLWGKNHAELSIYIKPPYWDTLAFKIVLTLCLSLIAYVLYRLRIQQHKERHKKEKAEADKKIIILENEKLESELKKLAFSVINKNKLLLEQKRRIQLLSNKAKVSVKEGLDRIVEIIDEDLDEEKDWKFIEPQIDKAYNHFISKLRERHVDLSATEIRIAAYIRMNLSTKEICELMNKTQRAVENDRYRLRKKIGLNTNDSIQSYLLNI